MGWETTSSSEQKKTHSIKKSSPHAISSDPPGHDEIGSRITAFSNYLLKTLLQNKHRPEKAQATLSRNLRQPREKSREAKRLEANLRDPIAQYHAACRPLALSSFDKPPPPGLDDATSLSTRPRV
ncbi:hypothetical protein CDV36_012308 [Fusarium kuroshium]|uniref:Uncharacterized protein n=1 Tax=Fusarium kuroshium TaxID=2010991 RepID=A0A3M2RT86_9HYPO|nr:hypothetical protein CDV36_012308 [Fusarium kuroshium]